MPELSLYALALLACPVAMGLMMRGGKKHPADAETANKQTELTRLQAQVDQLKADRHQRRAEAVRHPSS